MKNKQLITYILLAVSFMFNCHMLYRVTEIYNDKQRSTSLLEDRIENLVITGKARAERLSLEADSLMREVASRDANIASLENQLSINHKRYKNEIARISNLNPVDLNLEYYREIIHSDSLDRNGYYQTAIQPATGAILKREVTSRGQGGRGCHLSPY